METENTVKHPIVAVEKASVAVMKLVIADKETVITDKDVLINTTAELLGRDFILPAHNGNWW